MSPLSSGRMLAIAGLTLGLCSCASLTDRTVSEQTPIVTTPEVATAPEPSPQAIEQSQFAAGVVSIASQPEASPMPSGPIQQTGGPIANGMPNAIASPHCPPTACPPSAIQFHATTPSDLRVPIGNVPPPLNLPELFPDEYLCDGGDRAKPVTYGPFNRYGLDTEDTVAEYVDSAGKRQMKPTNRVCVYAPRFASVRTIASPYQDQSSALYERYTVRRTGVGLNSRLGIDAHQHTDQVLALRNRGRASGLEADHLAEPVTGTLPPLSRTKWIGVFQDFTFARTGRLIDAEAPRLADGLTAAVTWSRKDNPVILGKTIRGQEVQAFAKAHALTGVEDDKKPGKLRIVKLADKKVAKPGDVITFTIRYDNLGDLGLTDIRIVDNLTPRLEYIPGSATSDRAGRLDIEDNFEGSLVLKFIVDEELKGGEGGVVTFQAKVR